MYTFVPATQLRTDHFGDKSQRRDATADRSAPWWWWWWWQLKRPWFFPLFYGGGYNRHYSAEVRPIFGTRSIITAFVECHNVSILQGSWAIQRGTAWIAGYVVSRRKVWFLQLFAPIYPYVCLMPHQYCSWLTGSWPQNACSLQYNRTGQGHCL